MKINQDIKNIIALLFVVGAIGFLFLLAIKPVPPENKDVLNVAAGVILNMLVYIFNEYFRKPNNDGG